MAKFTISTIFKALDQFSGPVTKMSKNTQKFAKTADASFASMGRSMQSLRRLAVGIGAALTTGLVAKTINDFANRGDEIAKTARMLGLSAEALQELRFAAERQGVATEDLNNAFRLMNNNLGQLKTGQGSLYTYLSRTNPALARQLRNVNDSEQAFNLLMVAIGKEGNTARRAALAQAAFGRSGQELIKLTEGGAEGLAALREEARKYGNIIGAEAAAASERFSDALTNLKAAGRSVINNVLGPFVAKIAPVIENMANWVAANRELINQRIEAVFSGIGKAISIVARLWKSGLIPAVLAGVVAFKAISMGVQAWTAAQAVLNAVMAANPIGLIVIGIAALIAGIVLLIRHWDTVTAAVGRAWAAIKGFASGIWATVVGAFDAVRSAISKLLDNPLIAVAGAIFAPFITIPLLIVKHWEQVRSVVASVIEWILGAVEKVSGAIGKVGGFFGKAFGGGGEQAAVVPGPMSPNAGVIETVSRSINEQRSSLDVNFGNIPAGTTIKQTGKAPGININTGFAFGRP